MVVMVGVGGGGGEKMVRRKVIRQKGVMLGRIRKKRFWLQRVLEGMFVWGEQGQRPREGDVIKSLIRGI